MADIHFASLAPGTVTISDDAKLRLNGDVIRVSHSQLYAPYKDTIVIRDIVLGGLIASNITKNLHVYNCNIGSLIITSGISVSIGKTAIKNLIADVEFAEISLSNIIAYNIVADNITICNDNWMTSGRIISAKCQIDNFVKSPINFIEGRPQAYRIHGDQPAYIFSRKSIMRTYAGMAAIGGKIIRKYRHCRRISILSLRGYSRGWGCRSVHANMYHRYICASMA